MGYQFPELQLILCKEMLGFCKMFVNASFAVLPQCNNMHA